MRLIIDADPIVYRSGFAGESNHYVIVAEDKDGKLHQASFKPTIASKGKKRATAWANAKAWLEKNELEVVSKEITVVPEELQHALQIVRTQITSIIDAVARHTGIPANELDTRLLLSGPGNFRPELATLKEYKGNRDPDHKPYHYQEIRNYLTGSWGAAVVHGREADDEVSIRAWEMRREGKPYCIATIDKDLDQIPGLHYDYMKHVFTEIDEEYGELFFWKQVVSGDRTDNIGGICGMDKTAMDWVMDLKQFADRKHYDWREFMWQEVVQLYLKQHDYRDCYYAAHIQKWSPDSEGAREVEAERIAIENARLVYMQREAGELWVPPGHEKQYLETELDD